MISDAPPIYSLTPWTSPLKVCTRTHHEVVFPSVKERTSRLSRPCHPLPCDVFVRVLPVLWSTGIWVAGLAGLLREVLPLSRPSHQGGDPGIGRSHQMSDVNLGRKTETPQRQPEAIFGSELFRVYPTRRDSGGPMWRILGL